MLITTVGKGSGLPKKMLASVFSLALFSPCYANNAVIHSLTQPDLDSETFTLTYSCWASGYCKAVVTGDTSSTATVSQGSFLTKNYSFGTGTYHVKIISYLYSGKLYSPAASDSSTISVTSDGATIYYYDSLGRLKKVEQVGDSTTTYTYDDADNRESKTITKD